MSSSDINARLEQLERLVNKLLEASRVQMMGPERILSFSYCGERVQFWLPDSHYDYIQKFVLNRNTFYEIRLLTQFSELGVVGPDTLVCDIGANIGNHSVFFGKVLGAKKVISFEPQSHAYTVLQRNLELNEMPADDAYRLIIGDHHGTGSVDVHKGGNIGGTSFKPNPMGDVPIKPLGDALDAKDRTMVGFMKIDVEGAQIAVLKGATSVIEDCKPVIWIELIGAEFAETNTILTNYGYRMDKLGKSDFIYFP